MKIRERYKLNKSIKVGEECLCPSCGQRFIKTNYQQAFCRTKGKTICKDLYWNTIIPTKRNNTVRISPASQRYINKMGANKNYENIYDDFHPFEGLNEEDYKLF